MLLLLLAGAGVQAPPPVTIKVFGRAGGASQGYGRAATGATSASAAGDSAGADAVTAGADGDAATGDSAARGGIRSGEEP